MNNIQVISEAAYFKLLQKDSIMLYCIDALDILTLEQWQAVQVMFDEETEALEGEEYER